MVRNFLANQSGLKLVVVTVYLNDVPVGTICCRIEKKDGQDKLYLMTMGVLGVSDLSLVVIRYCTLISLLN